MSNSSGIDVSAVVDDIATHIKNQFEGILARVSKDQLTLQENVNMILNLPIVKGLMEEKKELVDKIEKLVAENSELKMQLASQSRQNSLVNQEKNIRLEVRELDSDTSSVTKEEIDQHIKEKELEALKDQVKTITSGYELWKAQASSIEQKVSSLPVHASPYSVLQDDSDDEPVYSSEEDDDEEDDDEEAEGEEEGEEKDEEEDDEEDDEEEEEGENEECPQLSQLNSLTGGNIGKNEDEEEESEEEEEEFDVEDVEIDGKKYYTTDPDNGIVYECMDDGEIGDEIGRLEEGKLFLS